MLTKYKHLVIFPVHPTTLANYRQSFRPSGAKDDPHDAVLLLDVLTLHYEKLRRLRPDTPETRTLQFLVEERRKFVHERTRCSNRITAHLKLYYPQVLEWFDEIGSNIAAEFLERWTSLDKLQRGRPATNDAAVITACAVAVVERAGLLKQLLRTIEGYDKKIDALAREHPDYALIKSLPGAGPCSLHGLSPHWGVSETGPSMSGRCTPPRILQGPVTL